MSVNLHIGKWGGSLAVRIPKAIAEQWGISEGSAIEMDVQAQDNRVVMRKQVYNLSEMLAQVMPENLHPEQDTGDAQGNEQW
ncbi:MAG: AbrB/MazE/SpoVT family DNA-binding domain-containing protein [Gammaproteobacteria bacterium]|nr:AbrB/MazE/SpoVT family DNA-binding domain-containing protein [Gammaproteobacteria bacterium]